MQQEERRIHMIGNTHFDPVWLWTWDEGMASIRSTFRSALDRMYEEPEFKYSFSCPPVFEWIRRVDPQMFRDIQKRVDEGRWCLDEGLWLQPDCYSASGESYVRQCLYGQRYLMQYFHKKAATAFHVDSFGHSGMLPQIFTKTGLSHYVIGRPDTEEFKLDDPLFWWESPDGSRVLTYRICDAAQPWPQNTLAQIEEALQKLPSVNHDLMLVYGVTNHGGAPTKQAIADIVRKNKETGGRVIFSSADPFFEQQQTQSLATWKQEIPIRFFGVFSNIPQVKKENRRAEYALQDAERAAVLDGLFNRTEYPLQQLQACWRDVLFNQFHDILGGAALKDAYRDARDLYGRAIQSAQEITHAALQGMTRRIRLPQEDAPDVAWNIVVWNLHSFCTRGPIEAEVQWAWEFDWYQGELCVTDEQGREYPCQRIQARSVIPGFRSRFVFEAEVPAMGYRVFRLHQRAARSAAVSQSLSVDESWLESDWLRVELCKKTGGIQRITDTVNNRILMEECAVPLVLGDESDVWAFNFQKYAPAEYFQLESADVLECGELRAKVRTRAKYGFSTLIQDFTIWRGSGVVDGSFRVLWHEEKKTLKLVFHPAAAAPGLTASSPYCSVARQFDGKEMPVGEWLDIVDQATGTGVALLSDSFFAYDTADGAVRATVLRSPIFGDLHIGDLDPSAEFTYLSQGESTGRWRLLPHAKISQQELWQAAEAWNHPCIVIDEANHPGDLPLATGCLKEPDPGVWVTVIKQAEDGSGDLVVRLQNVEEHPVCTEVEIPGVGKTPELSFGAYEIKTLRWGEEPQEVTMLEEPDSSDK